MSRHPLHSSSPLLRRSHRAASVAWRTSCALVVASAVATIACSRESTARSAVQARSAVPLRSDAEIRELDLAFFAERAKRDPTGASDLAQLGALYLARARETGDPRDVLLAEEMARRSIRNRSGHNSGAASVLQSSLLAQHRFAEALTLAKSARDAEPENDALRAEVAEIEMELGNYDSARVAFTGLHAALGDLAIAPRLARWAEIEGRPDRARRLLGAALANARRQPAMPREQLAWYWLRVGDLEMRAGHLALADSAYLAGLDVHPGDYRLLSALAHAAALQHRWKPAIEFGEQSIAEALDPATLGTLSDAYAALGDSARSAEYARVLDVAVLRQPGAYHRAWSLFLLDHGRHVGTVARKVREELRTRRDVYGYDLLAWSLHKQGRDREAATAMAEALREGTQDAMLFYHAGMIERALGHVELARAHLTRALAINPSFHPTQPAEARAALVVLEGGGGDSLVPGTLRLADAHPLHTSLTEIAVDGRGATIRVIIRVFADDFAKAATRADQAKVVANAGAVSTLAYVQRSFVLADGRRTLAMRTCGTRRSGELLWICLEADAPTSMARLRLRNALLCDLFEDQINIVRSTLTGAPRSLLFTRGDRFKPLL